MKAKCPKCESFDIYFVQSVVEYWTIDNISNGTVDLGELMRSTPGDNSYMECGDCEHTFEFPSDWSECNPS